VSGPGPPRKGTEPVAPPRPPIIGQTVALFPSHLPSSLRLDVAIVGAGAAGLATGIFARRANRRLRVAVLDGAARPGAKILVSGGSRCNVTNTVVTGADFNGGRPAVVRRILRAFPVDETVAFFREIGVPLKEEPGGKLFPVSNQSRDVLAALLSELARVGAELRAGHRVSGVRRAGDRFEVTTSRGTLTAAAVVLAAGGQSLPKTGSDGWGYDAARALGHTIVPTTPALVPLVLAPNRPGGIHAEISGVSLPARIDVRVDGAIAARIVGAMLWTHFGISGPAALDASRHWLRARLEGRDTRLTASFRPDETFESLEHAWIDLATGRPRLTVQTALSRELPGSMASAMLEHLSIAAGTVLAELAREDRRRLVRALVEWPLPVTDSRGYRYAEVTAGGVPLSEINPASMASRVCPGLYLVGEILDADGRMGGFNFQWAWATARVAASALGAPLSGPGHQGPATRRTHAARTAAGGRRTGARRMPPGPPRGRASAPRPRGRATA